MKINQEKKYKLAVWALTPKGAELAQKLAESLSDTDIYLSLKLGKVIEKPYIYFHRLSQSVSHTFKEYAGHIFIMSTGIVVRVIARHIRHKTTDPAVVVMDEMGHHAISLLSGHIGGANALAKEVAQIIGAKPVITTATDVNEVPAIDMLAKECGLFIENPQAIKFINMAFLTGQKISLYDSFSLLTSHSPLLTPSPLTLNPSPNIFIDDTVIDLPPRTLILRPRSLIAGMGCNRNTDMEEMKALLYEVLDEFHLSHNSLQGIASITIKKDEPGLISLGKALDIPLFFFTKEELNQVTTIQTPSKMVEKHIGVKSVCEAAAILASQMGTLIVPKHTTRNATVAIARIPFTS